MHPLEKINEDILANVLLINVEMDIIDLKSIIKRSFRTESTLKI